MKKNKTQKKVNKIKKENKTIKAGIPLEIKELKKTNNSFPSIIEDKNISQSTQINLPIIETKKNILANKIEVQTPEELNVEKKIMEPEIKICLENTSQEETKIYYPNLVAELLNKFRKEKASSMEKEKALSMEKEKALSMEKEKKDDEERLKKKVKNETIELEFDPIFVKGISEVSPPPQFFIFETK